MKAAFRIVPLLILLLALTAACAPADPRAMMLEERLRWDVTVLNWAQDEEGSINISTRVSGPPNSKLTHLTVRVDFLDADDNKVADHWHTYDLKQVPRGGPADLYIRVPQASNAIVGLSLDMLYEPSAAEQERMAELNL
jgi:hypothetical protein